MEVSIYYILGTSVFIAIFVAIAGYKCLKPQQVLKIVFPYIKISGSNIVIFDFIITNSTSIFFHYLYVINVVQQITFAALFNTFFTSSDTYIPYDGLDCIAYYNNGSNTILASGKEVEMENVTRIRCFGQKFDITRGIGHTAAILTLSWIFMSVIVWVKLNWYYRFKTSKICLFSINLIQLVIFVGSKAALFISVFLLNEILSPDQILDIGLAGTILASGIAIFPGQKKSKSLAEYCKEAVDDNQGEEERALEEIKTYKAKFDVLVELAKSKCQEALAWSTLNEAQMNTITQVAYRRAVRPNATEKSSEQANSTGNAEDETMNGNTSSPKHPSLDQEAGSTDNLLGSTR